jgi:broad specificity phosphatase PhoE
MKTIVLTMLAAALAACATVPQAPSPQDVVFHVMRHLHTPEGERDPDLTAEGQAAAQRLVRYFESGVPAAIYVSRFKRSQQTAAPLAARFGLTPMLYDPADTPALIARVRAGPQPALIVGHSNTVPDIVEQLGGTRPAPLTHPDFGDIWNIARNGATDRVRIPE